MPGSHVPVLIVGGGPCGLALAIELGWRGVACLVAEQSDETIAFPTANLVNTRTMEFLRRWSIADEARHGGFPSDFPNTYLYLTGFNRHELARFEHPANGDPAARSAWSPEGPIWCPKFFFDPVLRSRARALSPVEVRFRCRLLAFRQSAERVEADLVDLATGRRAVVTADYLVGCDGPGSEVRKALGIQLRGRFAQDYQATIFFRSPLLAHVRHDPAIAYWIIRPGLRAMVATMNGRDLWRTGAHALRPEDLPPPAESLRTTLGNGIPFEVFDTKEWAGHHAVAERLRDRRVFIAGDAAHILWPSGGFGMNTAMGDAVDLGWKLAATLQGWGGPGLLASYDPERQPIGQRNVSGAFDIRSVDDRMPLSPALDDESEEGARARHRLGTFIEDSPRGAEFRTRLPGLELGYTYEESPVCLGDGTDPVPTTPTTHVPSARPGGRAPHAWLADGRSILDRFGPGFTLLRLGRHAGDSAPLERAARSRRLPLEVVDVADPAIAALYERRFVLVRPDGHVAWRADDLLPDAEALVDRVAGV